MTTNQKTFWLSLFGLLLLAWASFGIPPQINGFTANMPRRADGTKALAYTYNFGGANAFHFFTTLDGPSQEVPFTGFAALNEPVAEFVEDAIVVADTIYGTGIQFGEYQVGQGNPRYIGTFGNSLTRSPTIRRLRNGGLVLAGYRHDYSATLDVAYRNPTIPALPGGAAVSQWQLGTFVLESAPSGEAPIQLTIAEVPGAQGAFNVYFNRDGTHQIKRVRFTATNGLALVDYDGTWASDSTFNGIPRDGVMSPDMEFPFVASVTDFTPSGGAPGRILVSYAQSRMIYSETRCDLVLTRPVIVGDNGDVKTLVGNAVDVIDRSTSPCPLIKDRSGNVYCLYDDVDPADCSYHWKLWTMPAGGTAYATTLTNSDGSLFNSGWSHYLSFSCDGYIAAKDLDGSLRFLHIPMLEGPQLLKIERVDSNPPQVKICWDNASGYRLQNSYDLVQWLDVPEAVSPIWFDMNKDQLWFRLIKH